MMRQLRMTKAPGQRKTKKIKKLSALLLLLLLPFVVGSASFASPLQASIDDSEPLQLLITLTLLALIPTLLIMMTGFTRILIVLGFVRNATGLQQMPPNQVLIGLALMLNFFFMAPVIDEIQERAYEPYMNEEITQMEAIDEAIVPLRAFMLEQTYTKDIELFMGMAQISSVPTIDDIPTRVIVPAFITSELKRAFQIGFFIFVPFLVIDMIVASTLMSMGMMMLPPTVISLPFKVLLFVLVDGWGLVIQTLFASFQ